MMNQKASGISLIVLVITIIIIIILAGAVILSLNNSNIISKSKLAKESNDFTQIREMVEMEKSNSIIGGNLFESINVATTNEKIPSNYKEEIVVLASGQITVKPPATGTSKIFDITNAIEKLDAVYIPKGFVASDIAGENSKEGGMVIYEGASTYSPANDTDAKTTVNQFVWVPVEDYSKFKREHFGTQGTSSANNYYGQQKHWPGIFKPTSDYQAGVGSGDMWEMEPLVNYVGGNISQIEVNAMYDSVKKYKGFYIARYEAADGNGKVISQKGKTSSTTIAWGDASIDVDNGDGILGKANATGALGKSRAMYSTNPANNTTGAISTLAYGVQWDAIMRWYNSNGVNLKNSTSWGNYSDSVEPADIEGHGQVKSTGYSEYWKAKNIYDLAGNVYEWTMEAYDTNNIVSRVIRGGLANFSGSSLPVSYRNYASPDTSSLSYLGFRPTLYIK